MASTISIAEPFRTATFNVTGKPATVDFIENRLPDYHPAFQDPPAFDPLTGRFVSSAALSTMHAGTPLPDGRSFWAMIFPDAMALMQTRLTESKTIERSKFRIREMTDWDGVQIQLNAAQNAYVSVTGFKGWVKWPRRAIADNSHVASQTLRLVPGIDMTTSVINVVQSLLEASKNAANKREEVLNSFTRIEETFDDIEFVFRVFPQDINIRKASIDLVATILESVETVITFYEKSIGRKMVAAYFKGDEYEAKLTEGLEKIKERSENLGRKKVDADIIVSRREAYTQSRVSRENLEITRTVGLQTSNIENILSEVKDSQALMEGNHVAMTNTIFRFLDEARLLLEHNLRASTPTPIQQVIITPPGGVMTGWTTTTDVVWSLLRIPEEVEKSDMRVIDSRQESLPWNDRGRAEQVVNLQRFHSWIVAPHPAWLLLHGACTNLNGMTAMSLFCSTLSQTLRTRQGFLALTFFCGMHGSERDGFHGGAALLRSFAAQLLCQQRFNTADLHRFVDLASVQRGELAGLCQLFAWLVRQLPRDMTLICILDDLGCYERESFVSEASLVMSHLVQLMHDQSVAVVIKLFATSTTSMRLMRRFFPDGSVLDLSTISDFDGSSRRRLQRHLSEGLSR